MQYFYIIMRVGFIHEVQFTIESYTKTTEELLKRGIVAIYPKGQEVPVMVNMVDVSQVLTEDVYGNYIKSMKPKEYILNGKWYDGKEGKVLRLEKWKVIEEKQKIQIEEESGEISPEDRKKRTKQLAKIKKDLIAKKII